MEAMAIRATTGRHVNVLEHMLGYFKDDLDADTRRDVHDTVNDYAAGVTPLIVPVTLIRHYVRRLGIGYLARQSYLDLHPKELMLRNHL